MNSRSHRLAQEDHSGVTAGIDASASEWVLRKADGLDTAGQKEFAEWLGRDVRHQEAYNRLSGTWAVFDRAAQTGATDEILAGLKVRAGRRRVVSQLATVSSVLIAAGLLWFARLDSSQPTTMLVAASPAPSFESIRKLPDGSIVELNEHAEITVQYEPGVRRVILVRGEALFRVEKEQGRPFLVQAGSVEVRAVGTAFNVRLAEKAVEVLVTQGKVRVEDSVNRVSLVPASATVGVGVPESAEPDRVLVAGQCMVVTMSAADVLTEVRPDVTVASMAPGQIDQRLAWRIPQLEFGGMELAQAIALLNRHNRLQISLSDAGTAKLRISGVFRTDNPEGFVRIVEATFGLRSERTGEHEVVLRVAR